VPSPIWPLVLTLLAANDPQVPRVRGSVDLTITNLDVVVTDAKGRRVHGLSAGDLEVLHDGRPVPITNFQEYGEEPAPPPAPSPAPSAPAAPLVVASPAPAVEPARPPRTVILFVDRLRLPDPEHRDTFFGAVEDLLRRVVGPRDRAMIVAWERSLRTVVPFTGDLSALEAGLGRLARAATGLPDEKATLETLTADAAWFQLVASASQGAAPTGAGFGERLAASEAYHEMQSKAAAIKGLLSVLGGVEGRRVLILASHRFSRYAGLEYNLGPRARAGDPLSADAKEFDALRILDSVAESANAHGVTMYGLHPERQEEAFPSAADHPSLNPGLADAVRGGRELLVNGNEAEALEFVAEKTGGLVAMGPDAAALLPRVAEDLESYYSIGYAAPPGKPDRAVKVTVRAKDRSLEVRSRRAFVEKSDDVRMKDRVLSNLYVKEPPTRLEISVFPKPKAGGSKKARRRLDVQVRIPIRSLALVPAAGVSKGSFSVYVASAGPDGALSEVTRQLRPFEIRTADLERARGSYYTYELQLEVDGKGAIVSVGVLDEVGKEAGFTRCLVLPAGSAGSGPKDK